MAGKNILKISCTSLPMLNESVLQWFTSLIAWTPANAKAAAENEEELLKLLLPITDENNGYIPKSVIASTLSKGGLAENPSLQDWLSQQGQYNCVCILLPTSTTLDAWFRMCTRTRGCTWPEVTCSVIVMLGNANLECAIVKHNTRSYMYLSWRDNIKTWKEVLEWSEDITISLSRDRNHARARSLSGDVTT